MVRLGLVIAGLTLTAGMALGQAAAPAPGAPIANSQECFAVVDGLAQHWENHKYANKAESDQIGQVLKKLEADCEGSKFAEASKGASQLATTLAH